jgi:anti-anti-sigma factor
MALKVSATFSGNVSVIRCKGRIVAGAEIQSLEATLDLSAREFTRIVLNLGEVDRLDSTGLGRLVRYIVRLRKHGGDLRFAAVPPALTALFKLTMLCLIIDVYETEAEAITSFVRQPSPPKAQKSQGARVLVLDEDSDMCLFLTTVLERHNFDVISAICLCDAKILLETEGADYILIGPNAPQLPPATVIDSLRSLAPKAIPCELGTAFKALTALEATTQLLHLFGVSSLQEIQPGIENSPVGTTESSSGR